MIQPLQADQLHGNWATLMLPIDADESIDYARLADELDALIAANVDGLYTNGTAGEFHTQSEAELKLYRGDETRQTPGRPPPSGSKAYAISWPS